MQTFRNDKSQEEDTQAQSSAVATGVGYVLGFILYMFLLIYGSMVMQSVIEEKNNRVLEVMVSSVRPFDLMMGKILGVASVAIVQVLLWGVLIAGVGALVMPHLMPEDVMASAQAMQQGMPDAASMSGMNPEMLQAVAAMTDLGYIVKIFVSLLLFVFGGYLLYSAMFAAVGSAVDNVQDASQLQMPITLPIILALLMMFVVIKDPNSQLAFWFSIIPFTSPIVMMARIPYDIPLWRSLSRSWCSTPRSWAWCGSRRRSTAWASSCTARNRRSRSCSSGYGTNIRRQASIKNEKLRIKNWHLFFCYQNNRFLKYFHKFVPN